MLIWYLYSYLEEATQKRLVQQLYWSSVFQQRLMSSKIDHSEDYSSGWKKLLRCDALDESRSMMGRRVPMGQGDQLWANICRMSTNFSG